jgi:hypothetical protein
MNCPDENLLSSFMQGLLHEPQRSAVEQHLDRCASCASAVVAVARAVDPRASTVQARTRDAGPPSTERIPGAPALPPEEAVGRRIGRYDVTAVLGRGAMGVVYAARDPSLDRAVAIKVLRTGLGMPSRGADRLGREARALARLSHPNVVAVHDVGEDGGRVFVAMELVRGCTLRDWQRTAARSWEQIVDVLLQAGRGLAAAHAANILHRDFKPENVLVGDDGRVRVGDFGLARLVEGEEPPSAREASVGTGDRSLTATGAVVGTPAYMAPEQRRGEQTGPACDQFAFAVTLYESLWGARPYGDVDVGRLRPDLTHPGRPPAASPVPAWIFPILEAALDLDPGRRHPSMQVLLDRLTRGLSPAPDGHVRANAIFQMLLCAMHTAISGFFLWVVLYKPAADSGVPPPTLPPHDAGSGVVLALSVWMALLLFSGWLPLGIPWTAVNAIGLWRGRRWALWSTLIYGFVAIPTCLGTPYAVYAIYSLWSRARKKRRN